MRVVLRAFSVRLEFQTADNKTHTSHIITTMNYGIHNLSIDMFADFDASAGATTAAGANTSTGTNHNLSTLHEFEESLLDLTLQEMADDDAPATSATSRPATVLWDAWKNASLANMCGPALRSFLLHKAATLCDAADEASPPVLAVMYETAALSIWTLWKFQSVLPQQRRGKPVTKGAQSAAARGNVLSSFNVSFPQTRSTTSPR